MQTVVEVDEKDKKVHSEAGYFTVEAVFLVTAGFLIIFAVMVTGLYLCDLNMAKSYLYQRVTELSRDEDSYEKGACQDDRAWIARQLFVTKLKEFSISKGSGKVKGKLTLSMKINLPIIGDWMGSTWTDSFSLDVDVGNQTEQMRRWDQIE